jgi:hypothetical protein
MQRTFRGLVVLAFASQILACAPGTWAAIGQGLAAASAAGSADAFGGGVELLVFGGEGHDTFLGCLSCSQYASGSMFNRYGSFGSQYSSTSIFNKYSTFGSLYSQYSACARYAADPPVIVDRNGNFYGRLTLNVNRADAVRDARIVAWLTGVCQ